MTLRAQEVFTPGAFPARTYVERTGANANLESDLKDAINTPGQVVSLVGPSKSGKTVLVEKVVGTDLLIPITGAGIGSPDQIWSRTLDWMQSPSSYEQNTSASTTVKGEIKGHVSGGIPLLAKAGAELAGAVEVARDAGKSMTYERAGLSQVVRDIANSDYVVLVDDFHYMSREVQSEAAKTLKEAVRLGIKVCTASVVHRGDDLVRANPELRGRVRAIDLKYWDMADLIRIAISGFGELNMGIDAGTIQTLAREAAGSPQLMQLLCLHTCFVLGTRRKLPSLQPFGIPQAQMQDVLEQASASTDFRSLVDVLDAGPKTRGTERKIYNFKDRSSGDVYRAVLKAVASDPPALSFSYDNLLARVAGICVGESPVGSSVVGTCLHLSKLALEKFPKERAIDWDEQKQILDVPDPYLLFYLRWSDRLLEPA